jgi:hypothetical protein
MGKENNLFPGVLKELRFGRVEACYGSTVEVCLRCPDVALLDDTECRSVRPAFDEIRRELILGARLVCAHLVHSTEIIPRPHVDADQTLPEKL